MKTLEEVIGILSLKQHMDPQHHPVETDEIKAALWYLRNYEDLLLDMQRICQDIEYIKEHYLKDLRK